MIRLRKRSTQVKPQSSRIAADYQTCVSESISLARFSNSFFYTTMIGPAGTPYEDGLYLLTVEIPDDYPIRPPRIKFVTPIFHPNISEAGLISLNILCVDWKPCFTLSDALLGIQWLLSEPNFNDPMNREAAAEHDAHPELFEQRAAAMNRTFAM